MKRIDFPYPENGAGIQFNPGFCRGALPVSGSSFVYGRARQQSLIC